MTITNTLRFEQLEKRELAAADVTAAMSNGNLYLSEVASIQHGFDQAIMISSVGDGRVRVSGLTSQNPTDTRRSLVNGAAYRDFSVDGSIYVNFRDGSETVKLTNLKTKNVEINTSGMTWQWPDSDLVEVNQSDLMMLVAATGIGNDTVRIRDTLLGIGQTGTSYLIASTGDGLDTIDISELHSSGVLSFQTGNDADQLRITNTTVHNAMTIDLGAGADRFNIINSVARYFTLRAGSQNDVGVLDGVNATYGFNVNMGDGDDNLTVESVDGASGELDGGNGYDTITLKTRPTRLSLRNWERVVDIAMIDIGLSFDLNTRI